MVDSKNISSMEESIAWTEMEERIKWEKSHNYMLHKENCHLYDEVLRLRSQINDMQDSHLEMESKMEYPPSKETTSCAACLGETAGGDNYLSNNS